VILSLIKIYNNIKSRIQNIIIAQNTRQDIIQFFPSFFIILFPYGSKKVATKKSRESTGGDSASPALLFIIFFKN